MALKRIKKLIAVGLSVMILSSLCPKNVSAEEQNTGNDSSSVTLIDEEIMDNYDMSNEDVQDAIYKMENFDGEDTLELFSDDVSNVMKMQFQEEYGTEDIFKLISNENGMKTEVNGFRGIIKITENNEETIVNYFESIDDCNDLNNKIDSSGGNNLVNDNISLYSTTPSRPSAWKTQGPDKLNLKVVKGTTRDTLYATCAGGLSKTYTKSTSNWYSGYTKGFYDNIQDARQSWGTCLNYVGGAGQAVAFSVGANYVKKGLSPKPTLIAAAIRVSAAGVAIYDVTRAASYMSTYLGHVIITTNNWTNL